MSSYVFNALIILGFSTLSLFAHDSAEMPRPSAIEINKLRVPAGFAVNVYAFDVPGARSMTLGAKGTVFVGTRQQGRVYALVNRNGSDKADEVVVIARGLRTPNGVAFHNAALYVSEATRLLRFDNIEMRLNKPPEPAIVSEDFPRQEEHGWKFIAFGPDDMLYVPVGLPCDMCMPEDKRFGTIMRMRSDGTGLQVFARGLRNSVGFDWDPATKQLWFTENGTDDLGQNIPPDELNRADREGLHFGFPYCHGKSIPDPFWGEKHGCKEFVPAEVELGPHVAPLGMRFYTGDMFPKEYRNQIFIAEHGSTNRTVPIGYRITLVRPEAGREAKYEVFAEGWLQGNHAWGRPVDVLVMPDGALLVSDDAAGVIYRISYRGKK